MLYRNQVKWKTKVSIFHKEAKELEKSRQLKEQKRQVRDFNLFILFKHLI